jgi:hypothetical protein
MVVSLTRVSEGKCVIERDCEVIGHVRSHSSKVPSWPDAFGHLWSDAVKRQVKVQLGSCMIGRVRSSLTGTSGHSALTFGFRLLHSIGASGHIDQRVRSVRVLLIWQVTVGFVWGVYKYIPSTSFRGPLLICSAEKHLWSARECKSPSEDSDLRIKVWDSSLVTRV